MVSERAMECAVLRALFGGAVKTAREVSRTMPHGAPRGSLRQAVETLRQAHCLAVVAQRRLQCTGKHADRAILRYGTEWLLGNVNAEGFLLLSDASLRKIEDGPARWQALVSAILLDRSRERLQALKLAHLKQAEERLRGVAEQARRAGDPYVAQDLSVLVRSTPLHVS